MSINEDLKEYDLHMESHKSTPVLLIDFEIKNDKGETYAEVWGSNPFDDCEVSCYHDISEFDDDETVGECPLCGTTCNWIWVHDEDGKHREPYQWTKSEEIGGIIGKYLKELRKTW